MKDLAPLRIAFRPNANLHEIVIRKRTGDCIIDYMQNLEEQNVDAIGAHAKSTEALIAKCEKQETSFVRTMHDLAVTKPAVFKALVEASEHIIVLLGAKGEVEGYKSSPGFHYSDPYLDNYIDAIASKRKDKCMKGG